MGLDNGIILKTKTPKEIVDKYNSRLVNLTTRCSDSNIEVCYWRKCWGVRNQIVNKFHFSRDGGNYKLDAEDIPAIIKILFNFHDEKIWEEDADSIWEWDEFKDTLEQQIKNLFWLYNYMIENPKVEVYFYDSY